MIYCPQCNSKTEAADSRDHEFNVTKRRRICPVCEWRGNSLEVLVSPDAEGKHTNRIAYQVMRAAQGNSEAATTARMLRGLADEMEKSK